jgi:hypothetical protein
VSSPASSDSRIGTLLAGRYRILARLAMRAAELARKGHHRRTRD